MTPRLPWPLAYTVSGDDWAAPMPLGHAAPLTDAVRHLAELGCDDVEVQVRETGARDAEALRRTVEAADLRVLGIGTGPVAAQDRMTLTDPSPDVRRRALSRLLGAAALAGELGVPVTLGQTHGTFLPGLEGVQRVWAERAVAPDEARVVIESLGAPAGLVLDTHHLDAEGVDTMRAVTEHAPVAGCLQLAAPARGVPCASAIPDCRPC